MEAREAIREDIEKYFFDEILNSPRYIAPLLCKMRILQLAGSLHALQRLLFALHPENRKTAAFKKKNLSSSHIQHISALYQEVNKIFQDKSRAMDVKEYDALKVCVKTHQTVLPLYPELQGKEVELG